MDYVDRFIYEVPEPYRDIDFLYRPPEWSLGEHEHSYYQLILVFDGAFTLTCGGRDYHLQVGQLCIIPPLHPHSLRTKRGFHQLGINLQPGLDRRGLVHLLEMHIQELTLLDKSELLEEVRAIDRDSLIMTPLSRHKLAHLSDRVLLTSIEDAGRAHGNEVASRLLAYLSSRLGSKPTLGELTRQLAVSQTQLERISRREFGCSVMGLFTRLRISKACALLANSSLMMEDISGELGFYDQAHFSRCFKQAMHVGPRQYRRMKQDGI
jgi:AraC-like DNA-binding protein